MPATAALSDTASPLQSALNPLLPNSGKRIQWGQLYGSADALALAQLARQCERPLLIITPDNASAAHLRSALLFFLEQQLDVQIFPDWETLPYDVFSPLPELVSERLALMSQLPLLQQGVVIASFGTLMQRLAPREYVQQNSFQLAQGDVLNLDKIRRQLESSAYQCVPQVYSHGEFAVRGSLLDLFPMGCQHPFRIDLLDNEVDSIRTFDPESQRSIEKTSAINLLPAREFPFSEEAIKNFRRAFRNRFEGNPNHSLIYSEVSAGHAPGGLEYYLPLFFEHTHSLFDYLPDNTLLAYFDEPRNQADELFAEIEQRFEQRRHDPERPLLAPLKLYLSAEECLAQLKQFDAVNVHSRPVSQRRSGYADFRNYASRALPPLAIQARHTEPAGNLQQFIRDSGARVLFLAETAGRREVLLDTLAGFHLKPELLTRWEDFLHSDTALALAVSPLQDSLWLADANIAIITETALFGERVQQRRRRKAARKDAAEVIRDLTELNIGSPVVHEEHGVGRYLGLQKLDIHDSDSEFLTLEYAKGDKLYVPVSDIQLISRYSGAAVDNAPLHRLGGEQWQKVKNRAAKKAADVAAELLEIYARREARSGFAFPAIGAEYEAFAADFEFEETPDQANAIEQVLEDMQKPRPMDRVVCGDVGFGKTEVAMRAAFMSAMNGRQVAVLVPTTLLAQQHFNNFLDRFADWPLKIANLSRFSAAKHKKIIQQMAEGEIDIVVGTHKLLGKQIRFKRLGLVIVDEEHRFGVRHKEQLKKLRAEVDLLTLTATPIPRTLNMAMSGMRDLSIIATPPVERHPINTFVNEWHDAVIREACERELKRGGQIYFLHNEVSTIHSMAEQLAKLVPGARIGTAHGQMRERELESVMRDFYHQRFNLLLCTTIIESGIDVPSANTILINRADKLGLAQLHQLRGRVGRSHHRAYAYLLVPGKRNMTTDAAKRLQAFESLNTLGAGFTLATHDLEIRGAGELLGDEQSGQIQEIGFSLYNELLQRAVKTLKSGGDLDVSPEAAHGTHIDLQIPSIIPQDYLPDVHTRLVLYKRIASCRDKDQLREMQVEMIDRFGLLPDALKNLFAITRMKLKATAMGIRKLEASASGVRLLFAAEPKIDAGKLISLIQQQPQVYQLKGNEQLRMNKPMQDGEQRLEQVYGLLDQIS